MNPTFFQEITREHPRGVAYKNLNLKKKLLAYLAEHGNATIGELCKAVRLSVPKVTSLLNSLIDDELVRDYGKDDSSGGRPPSLYGLTSDSAYFLGIDVKRHHINLGITDFQNNLVKIRENYPYELANKEESLQELCQLIRNFISGLNVAKEKILGIGINLSGRINYKTGYSYSFFHFQEDPLSHIIESEIGIQVFLENDSRAMAYGEYCAGTVQQEKDVLVLNLDYGIGMGIIINGQLYYGKSGYSGEFGHIPIFDNDIICQCGKKGCLETEASGWALVREFRERMRAGSTTMLSKSNARPEEIMLEDIIEAARNDDVLAIELVAETGEKLGRGIAALINIFNPELVVLGGCLSATEDYIRLPIKSTINKYSLSLMNNDTQLKVSALGNRAGVLGACLLVRSRLLAIN
ncbi:MAG: ROK family protein [Phaeodactylibacter sp.]|nr:ROK family protein [Phaeodactylibacter sp.]MCB9052292.1 ROK family protein [Lewinellaceae bacterium]